MKLKRKSSKALTLLILSNLVIPTSLVFADNKEIISDTNIPNDNNIQSISNYDDIQSITAQKGPIKGYKKGKTVSRTRYDNFNTIGAASAFVGMLLGVPPKEALSTAGTVCWAIQSIGVGNVYYKRTLYTSPDGWQYYYKYDFYKDSGYNKKIGTTYSTVYGKWAIK